MSRSPLSRVLAVGLLAGAAVAGPAGAVVAQEGGEATEGPVVGTPPTQDAAAGWIDTYMGADYWTSYLEDAIDDGHVNLPYPTDPVKPEAYLDNVPVDPGSSTSALPVHTQDLSGLTYEWDGETRTLDEFVRTTRTDGVVFVVDGTVIGEQYANGYGPQVRHQPWSVTKTFVAAVVGIAHDEGLIASLQDPIDDYIDELAGTAWEGVTIEHLLQMESGVHWDEDTPVLAVNTQVEEWAQLALDMYSQGALGQTRNEFLAALPHEYEQGTEFHYNSGNTQVLAWLTEVLYDATFNEVLSAKLWKPMGADGDAVMTADRVGGVVASHGLFARPYDFARFGELLRNGGRTPEGRQVVPASWVDAMTTMTDVSDGRYGYQTWAHPIAGEGAYSASGFQGQKITVVPDACVTGVRLSYALGADVRDGEATDPEAYGFSTEFYSEEWQTLLAAVAEQYGGCAAGAAGPGVDGAPGSDRPDDTPAPDGAGDPGAAGAPGDDGLQAAGAPLPATGGGLALLGLAVAGVGATVRRRR